MKKSTKRILIIDDDAGIIDATKLLLEFEGYEVISDMGVQTIDKIKQSKPDLILLDLWLTEMDGRVFCQSLKKDPQTKTIPVILFSASRTIELNAKQAQADDFVTKPFEMDQLLTKIDHLLHP